MNLPKLPSRVTITFDAFFKLQAREFFGSCGYQVEAEHEMLKMPKRLDVLVIKTSASCVKFEIFDYFSQFNLISYKSYGDRVRFEDIYDTSIYTNLYLRENHEARYGNTTVTLICSSTPRKFIQQHKEFFEEVRPGHFIGNYGMYQIHIINIEAIQLGGPDGVFLSEFCRDIGRLADRREIEKCNLSSQIIDKLIRGVKMRMTVFEGKEEDMVPVADVTEIVRPQLEKAWNDGIEKGIKKGRSYKLP